jgi:hypothetical protein
LYAKKNSCSFFSQQAELQNFTNEKNRIDKIRSKVSRRPEKAFKNRNEPEGCSRRSKENKIICGNNFRPDRTDSEKVLRQGIKTGKRRYI